MKRIILMVLLCTSVLSGCHVATDTEATPPPTVAPTPIVTPTPTLTPDPVATTSPETTERGVIDVCESDTLARDIIPQLCAVFELSEDAVCDALATSRTSTLINDTLVDFRRMEGIIPPGQYTVYNGDELVDIVNTWISMAEQRYAEICAACDDTNTLSPSAQLSLAAVIEWECLANEYRNEVATVFLNRLEDGSRLQSCVTAEYALSYQRPYLTGDDVSVDSPYNTYVTYGVPVGPICVVDDESLRAAILPGMDSDIYFFFYDYALDDMLFFSDYGEFKDACTPSRERFEAAFNIDAREKINKQELFGNGPVGSS